MKNFHKATLLSKQFARRHWTKMTFWRFLFVLSALGDVKSAFGFDGPSSSVVIQRNGSAEEYGRSLGYSIGREGNRYRGWRQNFAFLKTEKPDYSDIKYVSEDPLDRGIIVVFKPTDDVRIRNSSSIRPENKSDPVAPLHVTNTARKECIEGFKADENGICQKFLTPKGDKSFKLKRRKRAEQGGQKLSYADVVKYGRNPPKNIGALTTKRPEIVTTVLPSEKEKFPATTLRTHSKTHYKATTATPKEKELAHTLSPTIRMPVFTTLRTPPSTTKAPPTTIKAPPATTKAHATTIKAPTATVNVPVTTIKTPPATIKALLTTVNAPLATTTTKTTTVQKTAESPGSLSSSVDINQAFLSVEKSSAVAQHQGGKVYPPLTPMTMLKKTFDPTRLRRRALV